MKTSTIDQHRDTINNFIKDMIKKHKEDHNLAHSMT